MTLHLPTDPRRHSLVDKLERRVAELRHYVWTEWLPVGPFRYKEGDQAGAHLPDCDDRTWESRCAGDTWGRPGLPAWFRARVTIPDAWRSRPLALRLDFGQTDGGNLGGTESLLYVGGRPLQGLDRNHADVLLPVAVAAGGELDLAVHAFPGLRSGEHRINRAQLAVRAPEAEALYWNLRTALEAALSLPEGDNRQVAMLEALNDAVRAIDWRRPGSPAFYGSLAPAAAALAKGLETLRGEPGRPRVTAVGHSHIDVAWLWPLWVTRQKASRTFSTVLHLMDEYPEYRFIQSQPQLYQYVKEDHPELFARIRERVAEGRWEATGAMWVEPDCNIPSGESLVRQILYGTRFFREEFGVENTVLWLPDTFGFTAALPQIMAGSGLHYFMTTKISWNQVNRFPYDTFRWRGLDGSEVLAHFITTPGANTWLSTYNGEMDARSVKGLWEGYAQKHLNQELLHAFGYGDGGGGPTREMLEAARRFADLPGLPQVRSGSVEAYFRDLGERVAARPDLPVWDGELYLEYHRGTYTSQARQKRNNRRAEILFRDAELFAAAAWALVPGYAYPQKELREGWELLLLNQFHDILPGSSIAEVYFDSARDYSRIFAIGEKALGEATQTLAGAMTRPGPGLVVFNSLPWERSEPVAVPWRPEFETMRPAHPNGRLLPAQVVEDEGARCLWVHCPAVPACGWATFPLVPLGEAGGASTEAGSTGEWAGPGPVRVEPGRLENDFFLVELTPEGQLGRLYDKRAGREVLQPGGRANVLQAFEDKPLRHDAWDVDIYYQEKHWKVTELLEATVEEAGPERGVVRLRWRYGESAITQRLVIHRRIPRLDFVTHVDWQERQTLLKTAFPVDVRAAVATFDIQFGNVDRPTHWNTPWDWARFETYAHKWADLSEGNYGVSLLNDCKYGHDVRDGTLRLTLLKSAIDPDPEADRGEHRFTYSLYPHTGTWFSGGTVPAAYALNTPLLPLVTRPARGALPPRYSFVSTHADHTMVEALKQAEDGSGLIIRLSEFGRRRGDVTLELGVPVGGIHACSLLEVDDQPVPFDGGRYTFSTRPFQLHTFRVRIKA